MKCGGIILTNWLACPTNIGVTLLKQTQIMNFQVAVFQNNIHDHEKVNVKSLDETRQTFNTDCTHGAKGWISFTTMANTGLARHFCRLYPPMPLSFIDTSLLTVT